MVLLHNCISSILYFKKSILVSEITKNNSSIDFYSEIETILPNVILMHLLYKNKIKLQKLEIVWKQYLILTLRKL